MSWDQNRRQNCKKNANLAISNRTEHCIFIRVVRRKWKCEETTFQTNLQYKSNVISQLRTRNGRSRLDDNGISGYRHVTLKPRRGKQFDLHACNACTHVWFAQAMQKTNICNALIYRTGKDTATSLAGTETDWNC